MLEFGLAAALGGMLGNARPELALAANFTLAALAIASIGWILGWTSAGAEELPDRSRRARWICLCAVAAASIARAGRAVESALVAPSEARGRWVLDNSSSAGEVGSIEGCDGVDFELPPGAAIDGEEVAIASGSSPRVAARGPIEPAVTRALHAVRAPLDDQIVRLAPADRSERPWTIGRTRLLEACDRARNSRVRALLRAVVCGDTSKLDVRTLDLFTRTGTRHLLAVSGQHVALVASFMIGPLLAALGAAIAWCSRGRVRFDPAFLFVALIWIYAPLAGGGSPVRRAAISFALAGAARALPATRRARELGRGALGRRADGLSLWGAALLAECVFDARASSELSLQLSYLATLGLVLATGPIGRAIDALFAIERPRLELASSWTRVAVRHAWNATRIAVAASFAAVLATLPLSWSTFGEFSLVGAFATVAALPLFGWMLAFGWLSALFPSWMPTAPFELGGRALLAVLEVSDRMPGTPMELPPRPEFWVTAAGALSLAALALSRRRLVARRVAGLASIAWGLALLPWTAAARGFELDALDVGHGTAVVLRAPGDAPWIFDAGSRDRLRVAQAAVAPLLRSWDEPEVSIALSHTDRDHWSALPWLGERFRARLWAGALTPPGARVEPFALQHVDVDSGRIRLPTRGPLELSLARGVDAEGNEGSRVLIAELGGRRWILCGDATGAGLVALLRSGALDGPCEVLLLPHHGAESEKLGELLDRARPREVWISSNAPAPVLTELERRKIRWRATWREGCLSATCEPTRP